MLPRPPRTGCFRVSLRAALLPGALLLLHHERLSHQDAEEGGPRLLKLGAAGPPWNVNVALDRRSPLLRFLCETGQWALWLSLARCPQPLPRDSGRHCGAASLPAEPSGEQTNTAVGGTAQVAWCEAPSGPCRVDVREGDARMGSECPLPSLAGAGTALLKSHTPRPHGCVQPPPWNHTGADAQAAG